MSFKPRTRSASAIGTSANNNNDPVFTQKQRSIIYSLATHNDSKVAELSRNVKTLFTQQNRDAESINQGAMAYVICDWLWAYNAAILLFWVFWVFFFSCTTRAPSNSP